MADSAGAHNYSYDTLERLTAATHPSQSNESYTFDDVGNRTASHQGSSYTYQAFNRLTAANSNSYGYNANGNLTSKTDANGSWTYTWDYENRLKQASKSGGVTVTCAYDALGRRVQRTSTTSGTTKLIYDGADVLRDLDGSGNTVAEYLNGLGVDDKLRQTSSGTASYFVTDHLGTTRALADTNGSISSSLGYDSYGNVASGAASSRYTYTGREVDNEIGLIYYRARWYDPYQGRFASEDPIGFDGGEINLYSYVASNPISEWDQSGLQGRAGPNGRGNYKPDFPTRCNRSQDYETIARNMAAIAQQIASAQLIDEELGFPRHSPPYSTTIPDSQRSFFNCKKIFDEKCKNCGSPGSPIPVPKPAGARRPVGLSLDELNMQEQSARQMEIFWKKVLGGSVVGGTVVVGGPPAVAALLRLLIGGGAAVGPAYAR